MKNSIPITNENKKIKHETSKIWMRGRGLMANPGDLQPRGLGFICCIESNR